ncbi:hypothetical protein HanLR1_Chr03g0079241 [Helianthus annuus]|nr:hypothetical protein HanLR1_Chr03g0079241 [Helianthus annuus]
MALTLFFFFTIQVFSNSGIATILVIAFWKLKSSQDICLDSRESYIITSIVGGIIGHYSCSNGDTWSSELGVLSDEQPRLITTFKVRAFYAFFLNIWIKFKHPSKFQNILVTLLRARCGGVEVP